jgi:hypothetical protein
MTGQAKGSMTHGRRNWLTSTSVIENRERLDSVGNAPDDVKTDRPPYVVNH